MKRTILSVVGLVILAGVIHAQLRTAPIASPVESAKALGYSEAQLISKGASVIVAEKEFSDRQRRAVLTAGIDAHLKRLSIEQLVVVSNYVAAIK